MMGNGVGGYHVGYEREKAANASGIKATLAALERTTNSIEINSLIERLKELYLTRASWRSIHPPLGRAWP